MTLASPIAKLDAGLQPGSYWEVLEGEFGAALMVGDYVNGLDPVFQTGMNRSIPESGAAFASEGEACLHDETIERLSVWSLT